MPDEVPAKESAGARLRRRHAERVASGVCTRCARVPPEPGLKVCASCAEKRRAADKARRDRAILEPGRHHYLIWLAEDFRGWKRVADRGRLRETLERWVENHPFH